MERKLISSGSTFEKEIAYSRAVVQGDWIFVSGTTGFDYATMTIPEGVEQQAEQCLRNIASALEQAGSSLRDVVRVTYILPEGSEFARCWPVLRKYFGEVRPAATMIFRDTNSTEVGKLRVTAVTGACSTTVPYISGTPVTGGYIAVGSSSWDAANNNPMDVYIVRTDNNGNKIWENTYDINGLNGIDVGASIIQMSDGSGFVVVGSTDLNRGVGFDDFDIFLMKIDRDGAILWSMVYGGTWEDQGFDLMEARTGSTVVVGGVTYICNPGDISVVGWTRSVTAFNGQRIPEGYIMRTNPTGVPIWGRTYAKGLLYHRHLRYKIASSFCH